VLLELTGGVLDGSCDPAHGLLTESGSR